MRIAQRALNRWTAAWRYSGMACSTGRRCCARQGLRARVACSAALDRTAAGGAALGGTAGRRRGLGGTAGRRRGLGGTAGTPRDVSSGSYIRRRPGYWADGRWGMTVAGVVDRLPRRVAGWAASLPLSLAPNSMAGISLALGVCAAVWFSAGTRQGNAVGALALCASYLASRSARRLAARRQAALLPGQAGRRPARRLASAGAGAGAGAGARASADQRDASADQPPSVVSDRAIHHLPAGALPGPVTAPRPAGQMTARAARAKAVSDGRMARVCAATTECAAYAGLAVGGAGRRRPARPHPGSRRPAGGRRHVAAGDDSADRRGGQPAGAGMRTPGRARRSARGIDAGRVAGGHAGSGGSGLDGRAGEQRPGRQRPGRQRPGRQRPVRRQRRGGWAGRFSECRMAAACC